MAALILSLPFYAAAFAPVRNGKIGCACLPFNKLLGFLNNLLVSLEDYSFCIATVLVVVALFLFYIGCPWQKSTAPPLKKSMRFEKVQDIFLLHHAYRFLGALLILGFIVLSIAMITPMSRMEAMDAVGNLFRFLTTGLAATFVIWAARQFERQLQQSRFEKAVDLLTTSNWEKKRAGVQLIADLPITFLADKAVNIYPILKGANHLDNHAEHLKEKLLIYLHPHASCECQKSLHGKGSFSPHCHLPGCSLCAPPSLGALDCPRGGGPCSKGRRAGRQARGGRRR